MKMYRPLNSTSKESHIRLCSLSPVASGHPIKCHIEAFVLSPQLEFEALSYTWGDSAHRVPIEANGETMLVTRNLADALWYLRKESDCRHLWIDAICINQEDVDERSKQVAMMGEIYRAASQVISWLGIRDTFFDPFVEMEHANSLFQLVEFLKRYPPFQEFLESNNSREYDCFQDHKRTFNNGLYSLQLLIGEREREKPSYWQRAWIIQEVASAQRLILQSGPYIVSEEDIESVADFIKSPKVELLMDGRYEQRKLRSYFQSDSFVPMSIYRSLVHSSQVEDKRTVRIRGPLQLLTLLRHNRSRLCADKRDKVYSVLGLSNSANRNCSGILVDYNKTITGVYIEAARAITESSCSLEVLCSANLAETTKLPGLPSWAPNWGVQVSSDACGKPVSYKHQRASEDIPASFTFWSDDTTPILSVTGFCLGSVLDLQDPFVNLDTDMAEEKDAVSRLVRYTSLHRQLSQAYKEMAKILHPKSLSRDLFRRTCSLGLLLHDLDDSFQNFMDNLDLDLDSDHVPEAPIEIPGSRFRHKLMASSINAQCMFAMQQNSLMMQPSKFADGMIGIAPPGVLRKGDLVCLVLGCSAPLILRPAGNRHQVVCAAYIDDLMDGSVMAYLEDGLFRRAKFDLE